MIPFQPNQMMGIMGGLPQGGVRPFQPSRGPTSFGSRQDFGGGIRPMPRGGMMMGNPFQGMGFGMGGQPQPPQVSPQPITPMTPTFAPQPQPASPAPMTEDERRMLLTTANPFSSGPDAINPMMGNRFNQARMEAGMGGIASLAPRQPIMNPFGRMGGLADLFRQRMQQFQTTQPPNPSLANNEQQEATRELLAPFMQPQPQPRRGILNSFASPGFGSNFANVMPQG